MFAKWKSTPLYVQIFICLVIGILIGLFAPSIVPYIKPIGDVFLRLLKMLIVPLTFFTLIAGVLTMGDIKSLRQIGIKIVLIFMATSVLASAFGVASGLLFHPGAEVQGILESAEAAAPASFSFVDNIINWFPTNIVNALATDNMLQIIFFAIFFGCVLLIVGTEKAGTIIKVIQEGATVMIKLTDIKGVLPAMLVAASTTSSAATLPMSMKCAEENLGLPEKIYGFGLPLGATINMNGMAVAIGLIAVFASNLFNYPITFGGIVQFVFLGLILSMGCAGVKGAGIVMSTVLLQTLGMPLTLIPILAAIWPVLDIGHTTVNITGDLMTTTLVASKMDMMDRDIFNK